jgi:hypothetical protein
MGFNIFHGIIVIFRNNLHRFLDFYHGTNLGAPSPKAILHYKTAIKFKVYKWVAMSASLSISQILLNCPQ